MAQFPLEFNNIDSEGVIEAINYALSGPSGLGQSFAGSSDSCQRTDREASAMLSLSVIDIPMVSIFHHDRS
jgi:hypothetical protein